MDPDSDGSELVLAFHARSPVEAALIASRLGAAGIPAVVEGGSTADEVSMSRQLMNVGGVRVMVPAVRLARARDVLAETPVSAEELEAEALAAGPPPGSLPADRPPSTGRGGWIAATLIATALAVLFLVQWLDARSLQTGVHGLVAYEWDGGDYTEWWRDSGGLAAEFTGVGSNGVFTRIRRYNRDSELIARIFDRDEDGIEEEWRGIGADGLETWMIDDTRDGRFDRLEVRDAAGAILHRYRFEGVRGWVRVP